MVERRSAGWPSGHTPAGASTAPSDDRDRVLKAWRRYLLPSGSSLLAAAGAPPSGDSPGHLSSKPTRWRAGLPSWAPMLLVSPAGRFQHRPDRDALSSATILESPKPAFRSCYSTSTRLPAASLTPRNSCSSSWRARSPGYQNRHARQRDDLSGYRPAGRRPAGSS